MTCGRGDGHEAAHAVEDHHSMAADAGIERHSVDLAGPGRDRRSAEGGRRSGYPPRPPSACTRRRSRSSSRRAAAAGCTGWMYDANNRKRFIAPGCLREGTRNPHGAAPAT
jgi:hypothetical protein